MKYASLILNGLLLLAVAYLYIDRFSGKDTSKGVAETEEDSGTPRIVFVQADSLLNKFEYFQEKAKILGDREQKADSDLKARGRALEQEMIQVQQKIQQGLLAPSDIQKEEQRLGKKQQALLADQERITGELLQERQKFQEELEKDVKDLLITIRQEKGYDYILSYGPGTGVLMVNDSLDITEMVLQRLNEMKPAQGS